MPHLPTAPFVQTHTLLDSRRVASPAGAQLCSASTAQNRAQIRRFQRVSGVQIPPLRQQVLNFPVLRNDKRNCRCAWASRDFKDTGESALLAIMGRSAEFLSVPAMPRCPSRTKGPDHSFGPFTMMEMTAAGISVSKVTDKQRSRESQPWSQRVLFGSRTKATPRSSAGSYQTHLRTSSG
jgi:hypothetical protein